MLGAAGVRPPRLSLPTALPAPARGARLRGLLARVLALVEPPLQQRREKDEEGEEADDDEAGVRDDLVVRLAVPALALVVRERDRCGQQEEDDGDTEQPEHGAHRIEGRPVKTLQRERRDGIEILRLDRPEVRNAMNTGLLDDLLEALTELGGDAEMRALVLSTTSERALSAGADVSED